MSMFNQSVDEIETWFASSRFSGVTRLYGARQVAEQRGAIAHDYTIAREAAEGFYSRLRALFATRRAITTFGPYSPGQAVAIKRAGIEGIYLGGWATSAKGSVTEDPGADLASYPLSQVPDEAAPIVRALLAADRNQSFARARMSVEERVQHKEIDYTPFIIADADTGHGGDAHVRNLIRRFVEVGVPGYHIEDQKPGAKKCGHQGGKVLVPEDEQLKRLNAARFQLDVMNVPGIIVARTDAESATFLDGRGDERDHPFILGATNLSVPSYKSGFLALQRAFFEQGIEDICGHLLFAMSESQYAHANQWLESAGMTLLVADAVTALKAEKAPRVEVLLDEVMSRYLEAWQAAAGLKTYGEAVADMLDFRADEGEEFAMSREEWLEFAETASFYSAKQKAKELGLNVMWNCEKPKTPEGYYPVRAGMRFAIAKSLAAAPFADLLWMETKTANLADAKRFADAIHSMFPDQMLAYNLSPSFNWDTTDMDEEQMRAFPAELGKLGYVFNFITYGGHQIDGLAAEEFAASLNQNGMLALATLQRKFRLIESPYRTPQTLVGGPRLDGALVASSGRTASTKAMGKGSTQFQHQIQTEVPCSLLEDWIERWARHYGIAGPIRVQLRPHMAGVELLELQVAIGTQASVANVVFAPIHDRHGDVLLSVRDENTFNEAFRKKRLMSLMHLFLIHRYQAGVVHYVRPSDDNQNQAQKMLEYGLFRDVHVTLGEVIVATTDKARVADLVNENAQALIRLIKKENLVPLGGAQQRA